MQNMNKQLSEFKNLLKEDAPQLEDLAQSELSGSTLNLKNQEPINIVRLSAKTKKKVVIIDVTNKNTHISTTSMQPRMSSQDKSRKSSPESHLEICAEDSIGEGEQSPKLLHMRQVENTESSSRYTNETQHEKESYEDRQK